MRLFLIMCLALAAAGCRSSSTDDWLLQLKDPDVVKRRQALRELAARIDEPERVIPALTEALHDESIYVRHDAAWALGSFGGEARDVVPVLALATVPSPASSPCLLMATITTSRWQTLCAAFSMATS